MAYLSNSRRLSAPTHRTRNLHVDQFTVLGTLFPDIVADLLVLLIIHQLLRCDHVEKLEHTAILHFCAGCASHHRHGVNTHLCSGALLDAHTGTLDSEELVANFHSIESFDG